MKVYVIGSLRNPRVAEVAEKIRNYSGNGPVIHVFDDWMAAGPDADDAWRDYEKARGRSYFQALNGHAAQHVFEYDFHHLRQAEIVVLVLPAGKSAFLEFGWAVGSGKLGIVLHEEQDPERWDVMLRLANHRARSVERVIEIILEHTRTRSY